MTTISVKNDAKNAIEEAVQHLRTGSVVAIPTETVYGLAADATNGLAVAKIFELKNRPSFNPLICHVDGLEMAQQYGEFNALAQKLAEAFWPGPLTLVVPIAKTSDAHELVTANLDSIGLRHPKGTSAKIISALGKPLAAPSANRSGKISPSTAHHVASEFSGTDLLIIDEDACSVGLESTIVKIEDQRLTLLRPGGISKVEIENATGLKVELPSINTKILAPGMMKSHYAPNAKVILNCEECAEDAGWLGFGEKAFSAKAGLNLSKSASLIEAASNLYSYLRQIDDMGVETICVAPIPEHGMGIAINDRLKRAAADKDL
ncbi:MAG: L-threonylcarbamoyladenylate synthase [Nitratireductor sp.]